MAKQYFTFLNDKPSPIVWANLFSPVAYTPKPGQPGKPGEPKYGLKLILDMGSDDHKKLKENFVACARVFPKFAGPYDLKTLGKPWDLGDAINQKYVTAGKEAYDFLKGKVLITARSKNAPSISFQRDGVLVEAKNELLLAEAKKLYFSGVHAHVSINLVAYEGFGGGITGYLQQVFIVGGGVKLSGGPEPSETFSKYVGKVTNEDPTKGNPLNDDIPF